MNETINNFLQIGHFYESKLEGAEPRCKVCKRKDGTAIYFVEKIKQTIKGKVCYSLKETILRIPPDKYSAITRVEATQDTLYLFETVETKGKKKPTVERPLMTFRRYEA